MAINSKQRQEALLATYKSSYKGVVALAKGMAIYQNQKNRDGAQFIVLNERVMSIPSAIFTPKNYFLIPSFDEKIHELKSAGLIEYWHNLVVDQKFLKLNRGKSQPKPLSFHHVVGCFQMLGVGFFISSLIFVAEFLVNRRKKENKKLLFVMSRK